MSEQMNTPRGEKNIILVVSGSCCSPNMALSDGQAQAVIDRALKETGVSAVVKVIPISAALQGAFPPEVIQELKPYINAANFGRLPAIIVNGKLKFWGIPDLEQLKAYLETSKTGVQ